MAPVRRRMTAAHAAERKKSLPGRCLCREKFKERVSMKYSESQKHIEQRTAQTGRKQVLSRAFRSTMFVVALLIAAVSQSPAQTDGIMVLQNSTTPRGGVWLNNSTPATPPGGHYWQTD